VTLKINEVVFANFLLDTLVSGDCYWDEFSVLLEEEDTKQVMLSASNEETSDITTIKLLSGLDRSSFNSQTSKLYVTPDDPLVREILADIVTNPLIPDWIEIRDWVANNIEYCVDNDVHGVPEYWQFANETLMLKTGDCEDFSILLCSLLLANGWEDDEVYVVIGVRNNLYHGWVILNVDLIGWQSLEPQSGALNTFIGDYLSLSEFQGIYKFNDKIFETI